MEPSPAITVLRTRCIDREDLAQSVCQNSSLHSIVSAGPSKHLFTKHLLFHLHMNSFPFEVPNHYPQAASFCLQLKMVFKTSVLAILVSYSVFLGLSHVIKLCLIFFCYSFSCQFIYLFIYLFLLLTSLFYFFYLILFFNFTILYWFCHISK